MSGPTYIFFLPEIAALPRFTQQDVFGLTHQMRNYVVVCNASTGENHDATTIAATPDFPGLVAIIPQNKLVHLEDAHGCLSDAAINARMNELNLSEEERATVIRCKIDRRIKKWAYLDERFDL